MKGRDFLTLANTLAAGKTEAEWRSAVSRAYYAAFHVARELFESLGFQVPRSDRAHNYIAIRLQNCGVANVQSAGRNFDQLRGDRNFADYDVQKPYWRKSSAAQVQSAVLVIQILDGARSEPTRTQITDGMKVYEQTVLGVVTWKP
jgi:uncharacterized protein (UPF0332 family)